ncbi:lysyl oxidase family protein [Phytohabitans sp. ZYX-F-186]|uniref:Lysyl oxidase family protein n=2 Tax=Phytohabitans maris TaxID=3071409 RepID=A0ABU0ZF82_9ACTN|nr:lysyl oxidase family protein [Phytohabitans sp. ZYX-F-186]
MLAAAAAIVALVSESTAIAAPPEPPLRLVSTGAVTVERLPGEPVALDPGTHVVAGSAPFEVRAARGTYTEPIVATRLAPSGAVALPAGLVTDFAGLPAFINMTVTDAAGNTVADRNETFCPNGAAVRTRPDAPASSPYPSRCAHAPFALGAVWGIQAGWSVRTARRWPAPLFIDDGTYTAVVSVNQPYRDLFGFAPDQWSATVRVTVRTAAAEEETTARPHSHLHTSLTPTGQRPTGTPTVPDGPRPDLRPLPAFSISIPWREVERDYLNFAATVWVAGTAPLVVDGFRRPDQQLMDAYQYFYDNRGRQVGYAPVGTMEWDPRDGHHHWHFTDFARYRLLNADRTVALRSGKEAFCLANTDAIDYTLPRATWQPVNDDLSWCGDASALAVRQRLDVGNGDTYTQDLPGQSFDITDLPNGTYYIEIVANPEHALHEQNTANNTSYRRVVIGGTPGDRTVHVPPRGLVDG